jgi:hypothetical protein
MFGSYLALLTIHPTAIVRDQAVDVSRGTVTQAGVTVTWNDRGVSLASEGKSRWQAGEHLLYRPDYLERLKAFVMVTDAKADKFHIIVVDRTGKIVNLCEISAGQATIPAVVPCGDTLAFADPGVFARAPVQGENNPGWLESRQQLNVFGYSISKGAVRWQAPELSLGQPLAGSGSYLWTVRLTNASAAYGGASPTYEIEQVGGFSGQIVRSWVYPSSGIDLTAYRWRAEVNGTTCTLHRLDPWPDATVLNNSSPLELALAKVVTQPKAKKKQRKKHA